MPNQNPPGKNPNDQFSLSDLLPDLIENSPPTNQPPSGNGHVVTPTPRYAPPTTPEPNLSYRQANPDPELKVKTSEGKKRTGTSVVIIAALIGVVIVPMLIFGVFVLIANSIPQAQPPSAADIASATLTPYADFPTSQPGASGNPPATPAPGQPNAQPGTTPPAAGSPQPNRTPGTPGSPQSNRSPTAAATVAFKSDCQIPAQASISEAFPCAKSLPNDQQFRTALTNAENQLNSFGHRAPGGSRYDYVADTPDRVVEFYTLRLRSLGYNPQPNGGSGVTALGGFRATYFSNGRQTIQVVTIQMGANAAGGTPKQGELVIRLSAS
jgi:hypothetical protein